MHKFKRRRCISEPAGSRPAGVFISPIIHIVQAMYDIYMGHCGRHGQLCRMAKLVMRALLSM